MRLPFANFVFFPVSPDNSPSPSPEPPAEVDEEIEEFKDDLERELQLPPNVSEIDEEAPEKSSMLMESILKVQV